MMTVQAKPLRIKAFARPLKKRGEGVVRVIMIHVYLIPPSRSRAFRVFKVSSAELS
jgi:hypothetical protein